MKLNKAQQKRINNAVKRGRVATMQRKQEQQYMQDNNLKSFVRPVFVRG